MSHWGQPSSGRKKLGHHVGQPMPGTAVRAAAYRQG
jgi:hypothetical protein